MLALAAWIIGGQIRSPAQIAAETSAPDPSAITVPVEQRVLSSEVIVRGTVRYGSPQPVVLATSESKQSNASDQPHGHRHDRADAAAHGSARAPSRCRSPGARCSCCVAHRRPTATCGPGKRGPDVRQLETALNRMGFFPGKIDGRYDGETGSAVASWYEKRGLGALRAHRTSSSTQLRAARADATQARDAYLQSRSRSRPRGRRRPGDIAQARIDVETARDAVDTAQRDLATQRGAVTAGAR